MRHILPYFIYSGVFIGYVSIFSILGLKLNCKNSNSALMVKRLFDEDLLAVG